MSHDIFKRDRDLLPVVHTFLILSIPLLNELYENNMNMFEEANLLLFVFSCRFRGKLNVILRHESRQ
jgi:hypothetical protein